MKKIYTILTLLFLVSVPRLVGAHMMGFGGDDHIDGSFMMGSSFWGWLMVLGWIVWIAVGIVIIIWLLRMGQK